jgi:D-alanine-D-alanine ligase
VSAHRKLRIVVAYNRDYEGAEADPENRAREDIKNIADHLLVLLNGHGFEATGLGITDDVFGDFQELLSLKPDVVFNLCESVCGDSRFEPLLPLLWEKEGIPFTGSGSLALSLSLHKHKAKELLVARGVPTPGFLLLSSSDVSHVAELDLGFPLIVKPCREDASVGISASSVVHDAEALKAQVAHVIEHYRQPALVEQFIEGREIYVSVLDRDDRGLDAFPFYEIDFGAMPADRPKIVSFEGKWVEDSVDYVGTKSIPCRPLPEPVAARVRETALAAFAALELRDYGRIDLRVTADGTPYVIDVNPNCDLSAEAGGYAKAARLGGLSYEALVLRLVDLALARRNDADTIPLTARSRSHRGSRVTGRDVSSGRDRVRDGARGRGAGQG